MQKWMRFAAASCALLLLTTGQTVKPDEGPDKAFLQLANSVADGKLESIWTMLPASYQSDVKGVITAFADKMDGEIWAESFTVARKLTRVLREKKEFILANPQLAALPIDKDTISKGWDPLVGIIDSILNSDIADLSKLKSPDPEAFLKSTGNKVLQQIKDIAPLVPGNNMKEEMDDLKSASATVVKVNGDTATVKTKVGSKEAKDTEFVKVDGKWIAKEMKDNWAEAMQKAKSQIAEIDVNDIAQKKPALMNAMKQLGASLDKLAAAKTAQDFESELGNLVAAAQALGAGG